MDAQDRGARGGTRASARMHGRIEVERYEYDESDGMECSTGGRYIRVAHANLFLAALDMPFLLLPFRPTSDPSAARTFIRNFFDRGQRMYGEGLAQELRLTEPMVSFNG